MKLHFTGIFAVLLLLGIALAAQIGGMLPQLRKGMVQENENTKKTINHLLRKGLPERSHREPPRSATSKNTSEPSRHE